MAIKSINMNDFNFEDVHLLRYIDDSIVKDIPLIYAEKINSSNYMKYDLLMNKHYGRGGEKFLKLVLMFNNKYDITNIVIGDLLLIPDINSLMNNLTYIDDTVNGVIDFNQLTVSNTTVNQPIIPKPKDKRKTTASPRLLITMEQPRFDETNGIIKY